MNKNVIYKNKYKKYKNKYIELKNILMNNVITSNKKGKKLLIMNTIMS